MSTFDLLKSHFFGKPQLPTTSLAGRTVVVTGANRGLGLEAAIHLARLNPAILILAVRDLISGASAGEKIKKEAGASFTGKLDVWELDLSSFASVQKFAKRLEELERLDVLVENAGVTTLKFQTTPDGWESILQINALSTGLLAVLALPLLAKTALLPPPPGSTMRPHLTLVGSELYASAAFKERLLPGSTLAALNDRARSYMLDRYNVSKLFDLFLAREISKLPLAKNVVVDVVNPGLCVSDLRNSLPWPLPWFFNKIAWPTAKGAKNIAWAAVEETSPGGYVSTSKELPPSAWSSEKDLATQKKVWDEMVLEWVKLAPEVAKVTEA